MRHEIERELVAKEEQGRNKREAKREREVVEGYLLGFFSLVLIPFCA